MAEGSSGVMVGFSLVKEAWAQPAMGNPSASRLSSSHDEGSLHVVTSVIRWRLQLQVAHPESGKNGRLSLGRL